jgi:hypothetical protein
LTALSRLVIESFRGDSMLVLGGLRLAQLIAWTVLGASLVGLELLKTETALPTTVMQELASSNAERPRASGHAARVPARNKRVSTSDRETPTRRRPRKK